MNLSKEVEDILRKIDDLQAKLIDSSLDSRQYDIIERLIITAVDYLEIIQEKLNNWQ